MGVQPSDNEAARIQRIEGSAYFVVFHFLKFNFNLKLTFAYN